MWNIISVNILRISNNFLIWTTWSLLLDVQLYYFSALTSNSGAGRLGADSRLSKLKYDLISLKYILIWGSTQKIGSLPLKWLHRSLKRITVWNLFKKSNFHWIKIFQYMCLLSILILKAQFKQIVFKFWFPLQRNIHIPKN